MQCIERISGGLQLRPAAGEVCEQDFSALARSWIEHVFTAVPERLICGVLDMA
jgi:hypothetical protein